MPFQALALAWTLALFPGSSALAAEAPAVFASGLETPSKIIFDHGYLYATESGQMPNTGRISVIGTDGVRRTLLDALPSGLAAPNNDPDGPNGLLLRGNVLYIVIGEGDSFVNGPRQGTILPNPNGSSSPIFATLLRVTFSEAPQTLPEGFTLAAQDHFTIADGKTVTLSNSTGQTAKIDLITAFRTGRPDAQAIYRNTHLYGIASSPLAPHILYIADAGNNAVWRVNLERETPRLVTRFPNTPNPTFPPGPPTSEAVPTSVHAIGNQLLVSLLSGAPFVPGASRVMLVDAATGKFIPVITNLSSAIDVVPNAEISTGLEAFVLEYSLSLTTGAPGRLLLYTLSGSTILADGLKTPVSLALDRAGKSIYILDQSEGTVLRMPMP